MNRFFLFTVFCIGLLMVSISHADDKNIPEQLQSWIPWVLKDIPDARCPIVYNSNHKICAYPDKLTIAIEKQHGEFQQSWLVYAPSWVPLPGDEHHWPRNILVNEQTYPVIERNAKPYLRLEAGQYQINGQFIWRTMPKNLRIPEATGLIDLSIENKSVPLPDFRNGRVWLQQEGASKHKDNRLAVRIFRKITDSIPMNMTTEIQLEVSGRARELVMTGAMLKNFVATKLVSPLPAHIDQQALKIQVRPGQWRIQVQTINSKPVTAIDLPRLNPPWPASEIWVFEQQAHLRRINIHQDSIDASRTQLPEPWKKLPAYLMKPETRLSFTVLKRGNPIPEPDKLNLNKKIWLDFSGRGMTVNDTITGKLSEQWRLNVHENIHLGRVTVNGQAQLITENQDQQIGVELRHGNLNLSADSRIEELSGFRQTLNSVGWQSDFNSVTTTLYLPAGWRLFAVSGANATSSWITKWTLLDLFIVLITAMAIYKLFGLKWGVLALLTLTLTWHQSWAPQFIWLHLIVALALIRVLPKGRFLQLAQQYRLIAAIVLVLISLPFVVDQARKALYPQLEIYNGIQAIQPRAFAPSPSEQLDKSYQEPASAPQKLRKKLSLGSKYEAGQSAVYQQQRMLAVDPDARIQTGPGLPDWQMHRHVLQWDGPVSSDQQVSLTLMSPAITKLLNVLRIILVLVLVWRFLDINKRLHRPLMQQQVTAILPVLFMGGFLLFKPAVSEAGFPSETLLKEMQQELLKPAQCLPECASIESLSIRLSSSELTMTLRVHAQQSVSVPLPVPLKQWLPTQIKINGETQQNMFRQNNWLWVNIVQGSHTLELTGRVDYASQLQVGFPLQPHAITLEVSGWSTEGLNKEGNNITAINFLRLEQQVNGQKIEPKEFPVYAEISRTLQLGLNWRVITRVKALSGSAFPAVFNIPLLAGESVITDNLTVVDHQAIISLNKLNHVVQWTSSLTPSDKMNLLAVVSERMIERWTLNVSPIWHVQHSGIPVIYNQQGQVWQPQWQPWPGEQVQLQISRPEGVKGRTITIDNSKLTLIPGEQITTASLEFVLRSSQGGQHTIQLPASARLQKIIINGRSTPIRNTEDGLTIPVVPGEQNIQLEWQETRGITRKFQRSEVDMGIDSVNNQIIIQPGSNRWVLLTTGPTMGPAVLYWGIFAIILIVSIGLGRIKGTPLKTMHWLLLWTGLSASEPVTIILIAGTVFAFKVRGEMAAEKLKTWKFNLFQIGLVLLAVLSLTAMIMVIQKGLLGSPDMQITGNGSSSYQLKWFSDRIASSLPEASFYSVPAYVYRLLMLAWSLWLSFALIRWAQWSWQCFIHSGYWRSIRKKPRQRQPGQKAQGKMSLDMEAIDASLENKKN